MPSFENGKPLEPDLLRIDPDAFTPAGASRKDGGPADGVFGQDRAVGAIRLSAGIGQKDFNLFVMGDHGSGRHDAVMSIFAQEASARPVSSDWIYVNNFDEPHKPAAIEMPPGSAAGFRQAMETLVDDLANDLPALFEAEDYQNKRRAFEQAFGEQHEQAFADLMESTEKRGLVLMRTPMGFMVAATTDDHPMTPDEFKALPKDEQDEIDANIKEAQEELEAVLKQIPKREKQHRRKIEDLNFEVAQKGVEASLSGIVSAFGHNEKLAIFLDRVRADLIENADIFLKTGPSAHAGAFPVATTKHYKKPEFRRYSVNVIISHPNGKGDGAPVVTESLTTLANLVGRIEHQSEMGMLTTDFTMIKPGALHRANGGFSCS